MTEAMASASFTAARHCAAICTPATMSLTIGMTFSP
jgi:hypothetical protein